MLKKRSINPDMLDYSSRIALKLSCLKACDNDVEKASRLYDFLSEGISDLPDVTPTPPGTMEQIKRGTEEVIGWLTSHKEEISQGWTFVQSLRKTVTPPVIPEAIPPIPKL